MNEEILLCLGKVANSLAVIQLAITNRPKEISEEMAGSILEQIKIAHIAKECVLSVLQAMDALKELGESNE